MKRGEQNGATTFLTKIVFTGLTGLIGVAGVTSFALYTGVTEGVETIRNKAGINSVNIEKCATKEKIDQERVLRNIETIAIRERVTRLEAKLEAFERKVK